MCKLVYRLHVCCVHNILLQSLFFIRISSRIRGFALFLACVSLLRLMNAHDQVSRYHSTTDSLSSIEELVSLCLNRHIGLTHLIPGASP